LGIGAGSQKTRMMRLPGQQRSLTISSAVYTIHQRDGQTDGHWATAKTALRHSVASVGHLNINTTAVQLQN